MEACLCVLLLSISERLFEVQFLISQDIVGHTEHALFIHYTDQEINSNLISRVHVCMDCANSTDNNNTAAYDYISVTPRTVLYMCSLNRSNIPRFYISRHNHYHTSCVIRSSLYSTHLDVTYQLYRLRVIRCRPTHQSKYYKFKVRLLRDASDIVLYNFVKISEHLNTVNKLVSLCAPEYTCTVRDFKFEQIVLIRRISEP